MDPTGICPFSGRVCGCPEALASHLAHELMEALSPDEAGEDKPEAGEDKPSQHFQNYNEKEIASIPQNQSPQPLQTDPKRSSFDMSISVDFFVAAFLIEIITKPFYCPSVLQCFIA